MKNAIVIALSLFVFVGAGFAVGVTYTFNSDQVSKIIEGTCYLYPNNETVDDPEWVDPEDGTTAPQIPKYTNAEWTKEKYRRIIIRDSRRGLKKKARDDAAAEELPDDSVITE